MVTASSLRGVPAAELTPVGVDTMTDTQPGPVPQVVRNRAATAPSRCWTRVRSNVPSPSTTVVREYVRSGGTGIPGSESGSQHADRQRLRRLARLPAGGRSGRQDGNIGMRMVRRAGGDGRSRGHGAVFWVPATAVPMLGTRYLLLRLNFPNACSREPVTYCDEVWIASSSESRRN